MAARSIGLTTASTGLNVQVISAITVLIANPRSVKRHHSLRVNHTGAKDTVTE